LRRRSDEKYRARPPPGTGHRVNPPCRPSSCDDWWTVASMNSHKIAFVLAALVAMVLAPHPRSISGLSVSHPGDAGSVTWSKDVAPVMQQHCQGCHHPGDIAPFSLTGYDDAYSHRQKILRAVERRKMPPWKPVPGFGDFLDVRRLSDEEIQLIRDWVAAGAPEGNPKDLSPAPQWPGTWGLECVLSGEGV